jgi:hypothetical protein
VREKIDGWVNAYPQSVRDQLIARLRSASDDQHTSAVFELFLYQLLQARGCKIISIEPKLGHTAKNPDFLVENAQQERFFVEAVMATGLSKQQVGARARLNTALVAIDGTPSPKHFLDLKVTGTPSRPISVNKLKRELKSWIAGLPADETARQAAAFVWKEHDAKIEVRACRGASPTKTGPPSGCTARRSCALTPAGKFIRPSRRRLRVTASLSIPIWSPSMLCRPITTKKR